LKRERSWKFQVSGAHLFGTANVFFVILFLCFGVSHVFQILKICRGKQRKTVYSLSLQFIYHLSLSIDDLPQVVKYFADGNNVVKFWTFIHIYSKRYIHIYVNTYIYVCVCVYKIWQYWIWTCPCAC
jgi:hypothetical protein